MQRKILFTAAINLGFVFSVTASADTCVLGYGKFNDNLNQNQNDSSFRINARIHDTGEISGGIQFAGYIGHSGGRNQLVGHAMSFCSNDINSLNVVGPYAGYGVQPFGNNHAIICTTPDGVADLDNMTINNCTTTAETYSATLFSSGSNVKDTGTAPDGNRGFDDFNIAVVYGTNEFATSNGFIREGTGFVYVGSCDTPLVDMQSIQINCD